MLALNT